MATIRRYGDLEQVAGVFAGGGYNLMVVVGRPGQAKSRTMRAAVEATGGDVIWIRNTVTAFSLYMELYRRRDAKLLVIDDLDAFYADKGLVRLLKGLCESEEVKTLTWQTEAAKLDKEGIPREFTVSMKVAVITNDLKRLNANVSALEDRGRVYRFEPGFAEVHAQAGTWFKDPEIYDFVGQRLGLLDSLSLRDYRKAAEDKAGGLDWQRIFLEEKGVVDHRLILATLLEKPFATEEDRFREFKKLTGQSRATYFRWKKKAA